MTVQGRTVIFAGEFEHRIDPQGRVSMPARFRPAFEDGIVLSKAYDPCVVVYTMEQWEKIAEDVAAAPANLAGSRRLARLTFAGSYPSMLDRAGRVLLPPPLRDYAALEDNVVIVGTGRFLEIWSSAAWRAEREALDEHAADIAENAPRPAAGRGSEKGSDS